MGTMTMILLLSAVYVGGVLVTAFLVTVCERELESLAESLLLGVAWPLCCS